MTHATIATARLRLLALARSFDGIGRVDGMRVYECCIRLISLKHGFIFSCLVLGLGSAMAQVPSIFEGADLKLGEKLLAENKCAACHQQKFGGDGSGIYRPAGRINAPGVLRGMVEQCNTDLNLGLFPEEVTAIGAVLNRDYYRFK